MTSHRTQLNAVNEKLIFREYLIRGYIITAVPIQIYAFTRSKRRNAAAKSRLSPQGPFVYRGRGEFALVASTLGKVNTTSPLIFILHPQHNPPIRLNNHPSPLCYLKLHTSSADLPVHLQLPPTHHSRCVKSYVTTLQTQILEHLMVATRRCS